MIVLDLVGHYAFIPRKLNQNKVKSQILPRCHEAPYSLIYVQMKHLAGQISDRFFTEARR